MPARRASDSGLLFALHDIAASDQRPGRLAKDPLIDATAADASEAVSLFLTYSRGAPAA
jgi:hypothetical protein